MYVLWGVEKVRFLQYGWKDMIKQIFSVLLDLILFIHAWKKNYTYNKKEEEKKDCVFFSFWQHVQYLFQWKRWKYRKKKSYFCGTQTMKFFLVLMPSWKKINSKKEKNKTRQNIEQLISASSEISSFKSYDYTPQIFRGYK